MDETSHSLAHLHKCVGQITTSYQWLWAGGHFLLNCVNWELSVHAKSYHWYFTTKWSVSWKVNHSSSGINHGFVYYCGKPLGEQFQKVNFWKQLSTFLSSVSSLCLQSPIMNVLLSECVFWVHRGFFWQNGEGKTCQSSTVPVAKKYAYIIILFDFNLLKKAYRRKIKWNKIE